jgi:hypothetical protein
MIRRRPPATAAAWLHDSIIREKKQKYFMEMKSTPRMERRPAAATPPEAIDS